MGRREIYQTLRGGGLSRAGALAMMGNIGAESAFISNIVESRCSLSNFDYTHKVDTGTISRDEFCRDSYGYGLCQWTLGYRKGKLYDFARARGVSIGDEAMQAAFILDELQHEVDYSGLYQYLCSTTELYGATSRICIEYERPAVNNIDARYTIACQCANEAYDDEDGEVEINDPVTGEPEVFWPPRTIRKGSKGYDVCILQAILLARGYNCGQVDGDFGQKTNDMVMAFQGESGMPITGLVDKPVWNELGVVV